MDDDTIAAIATPPGIGGVAIVRVSGPKALTVADRVYGGRTSLSRRPTHTVSVGRVRREDGRVLDIALWLILRAPHSYTGEDVVEIQCHGGLHVPHLVLSAVCAAGARIATPGEFTRRAFLNGRMDLLQAESILDLIRAQTDRSAIAAAEQMDGLLSKEINALYNDILAALTTAEAANDFSEDDDGKYDAHSCSSAITSAIARARRLLATERKGRILREGVKVVIVGPPNSGKSTLFNALLGFDRAIVTDAPGTTRDTIEEQISLRGILIRLVDTAGVRTATCEIEAEGIRRAIAQARTAEYIVHVYDASISNREDSIYFDRDFPSERIIRVLNKCDLKASDSGLGPPDAIQTSAISGYGLDDLRDALYVKVSSGLLDSESAGLSVSSRHADLLRETSRHLVKASEILAAGSGDWSALVAVYLRAALEMTGEITGRTYYPELLNSIFEQFCVGK